MGSFTRHRKSLLYGAGTVGKFKKFPYYRAALAYGLFALLLTTVFEIAVMGSTMHQLNNIVTYTN